MSPPAQIAAFQKKVLAYYKANKRDLPWRHTTDPYHILLSEIMLQQTQVDRVLSYYKHWTKKWPTVQDLAKAPRVEVLSEWQGLGYNNRAVNLHKAAKTITHEFKGDVLAAVLEYKKVPGIGPYTSAAVRIFAANEDIVTVDTNIRRILMHEFKLQNSTDKQLWTLAEQCLPNGKSRDWHNALMDFGATLLTSRKTGIRPKTIQSRFEGSDRQLRAKVLRLLLRSSAPLTLSAISKKAEADEARMKTIIQTLIKDDIIEMKHSSYRIKS